MTLMIVVLAAALLALIAFLLCWARFIVQKSNGPEK